MKGCRPLSNEEVEVMAKSFGGKYAARDKALFLLGVKSGFRISEILSLRIGDVIQAERMVDKVTVQRKNMKKKTEGRTILLHPDAKKALADWLSELAKVDSLNADAYVFKSRKGRNKPISRVQAWQVLKDAYESNELTGKLGTHSMRKTFANKVYDALNNDLVKTQRALGHRNINSTVSYLSFKEEEIDKAILQI